MFTAKINNETTDWIAACILMTCAKAFYDDTSLESSSDLSDEAMNFCKNYLIDKRKDPAIGFDSKRKKEAKYIATHCNCADRTLDYSKLEQKAFVDCLRCLHLPFYI